jgi:hypothetical protein
MDCPFTGPAIRCSSTWIHRGPGEAAPAVRGSGTQRAGEVPPTRRSLAGPAFGPRAVTTRAGACVRWTPSIPLTGRIARLEVRQVRVPGLREKPNSSRLPNRHVLSFRSALRSP